MAEYLGAVAFFALIAGQFAAVVAVNKWSPETLEIGAKADFAEPALTAESEKPSVLAKAA